MKRLLFLFVALACIPASVHAHATPVETAPASGARLSEAPEAVTIRFSERLEPGSSNISLEDAVGTRVNEAGASVDAADPYRLTLPLAELAEGTYIVSWSVVSADDGHFTKGSYAFSVGSSTPPTATELAVVTISAYPEVAAMFTEFLGNSLLWGVFLLLTLAARPVLSGAPYADRVRRGATVLIAAGFALAIAGGAAQFLWKTYELAGLHEIAFADALRMYADTAAGTATLLRMTVLAAGAAAFALLRQRIMHAAAFGWPDAVMFGVFVCFAYVRATVSHATANPFYPELSVFVNTLHLIEKDLWLGVLLVLLCIVAARMRTLLEAVLPRAFSLLAANVLLVAATASYIIWLHLKSFANLRTTEWGGVFVWLGVCAAALVALRAYHVLALRFSPRLFGRAFPATVALEAGMALLVIWFSSQIIITSPPLPSNNAVLTEKVDGGAITLTSSPFEDGAALLTVPEGSDQPTVMVGEADGGLLVDLAERFDGGYVFPLALIARDTTVHVIAPREGGYDARTSFAITATTFETPEGHGRTVDLFTLAMIGVALLGAAAGGGLLVLGKQSGAASVPLGARAPATMIGAFVVAIAGGYVAAGTAAYALGNEFKRQCALDGNYWHLMQPTKAGVIVSQTAREGCMLAGNQYHFADAREYEYVRNLGAADVSFDTGGAVTAGVPATLSVALTESDGTPAVLSLAHDRFLHMVIVGEDMDYFAHVHPEDTGTADIEGADFSIAHTFPKAGTYVVAVDYLHGLTAESRQFLVDVSGSPELSDEPRTYRSPQTVGPYEIELAYSQPFVGQDATLTFNFKKDGTPVYDLEPYLAAAMHLAVVKHDLSEFIHTHGEVHQPGEPKQQTAGSGHNHAPPPLAFGPWVEAHLVFPSPGLYTVFGEFKHEGEVQNVRFTVRVE